MVSKRKVKVQNKNVSELRGAFGLGHCETHKKREFCNNDDDDDGNSVVDYSLSMVYNL